MDESGKGKDSIVPENLRRRFYVEAGLALLSAVLCVLTAFSKEWIEIVFRVDPDQGSGALEWAIAGATLAVTIAFVVAARLEWRRSALASA